MSVSGDKELLQNMAKATLQVPDSLGAALLKEGYAVWGEGVPLTPVESGILRRSWYVAPPREGSKSPEVEVGVGTKYGIYVHEMVVSSTGKPIRHPVGQAKFISTVLDKRKGGYIQRISKWTWEFYNKGFGIRAMPRFAPEKPSAESQGV
jgi:hypothetical protein